MEHLFFFFITYLHIARALYYNSYTYPRRLLWVIGICIFLLMIITAFLGYVLPWGQMSFWAATVITNFVSTIPVIGLDILIWLWGGFSINNVTLNRFYSLHYTLSFIILALSILHMIVLHHSGSNNPEGIYYKNFPIFFKDSLKFVPYYLFKDLHAILLFLIIIFLFISWFPNNLGHPDNYIPANPQITPHHIVPEWYFLPFYAILRVVPNKLYGVMFLIGSLLILLVLPLYSFPFFKSCKYRPFFKLCFWVFIFNFLLLFWIGGKPLEEPFILIGKFATFFYFFYFIIIIPYIEIFENWCFEHSIELKFNYLNYISKCIKNFIFELKKKIEISEKK